MKLNLVLQSVPLLMTKSEQSALGDLHSYITFSPNATIEPQLNFHLQAGAIFQLNFSTRFYSPFILNQSRFRRTSDVSYITHFRVYLHP